MSLYDDIQAIYADETRSEDEKRRARWLLVNPALRNAIEGLSLPATVSLESGRGFVIHKVKIDRDEKTIKFHVEFIRSGNIVTFTINGVPQTRRVIKIRKPPILVPHNGGDIIIDGVRYQENLLEAFRLTGLQIHRRMVA